MNKPLHQITDLRGTSLPSGTISVLRRQVAQKSLQICRNLQTTLDPERMIELFSMEVGEIIVHQGMRYRNDDLDLDVRIGRQARHACNYNLMLGDEPLGKLTFRRDKKFNEAEIGALEELLISLLHPMRNALLYQDALQLAQKDPLTGICNRAALDEALQRELSHSKRHGTSCALIVLDIDHFKSINDRYGHIIGDCALKAIASMAAAQKRDGDTLFRYGGEEFVILMRDTGLEGASLLAERIRRYIEDHPCICSGAELDITVSLGLSVMHQHDTPVSLFSRADQALYHAKKNGRNQVCAAAMETASS
jgi:diguanylate cyclase (GGDEF)-like protein